MKKNYFEDIPDRCKKCPVLERFNILLENAEHGIKTEGADVLELLDHASQLNDPAHEYERSMTERAAQREASLYEQQYEFKDTYEEAVDFIGKYVTDACAGSRRGTGDGGAFGALMWLMGERSCLNPNFVHLVEDDVIGLQLKLGNWRPPEQT